MSKTEFAHKYKVSRPIIDKRIDDGIYPVEEISGKHYIRINKIDTL